MAEPGPRPDRLVTPAPRTELAKLLQPDLWDRHPMAPRPDPAQIEERKSALLAATTSDGRKVQMITIVTRSRKMRGYSVSIEPTGGTVREFAITDRFDGRGNEVRQAIQAALEKMRQANYQPEINGLDL